MQAQPLVLRALSNVNPIHTGYTKPSVLRRVFFLQEQACYFWNMSKLWVAINGFGRIGRQLLKVLIERDEFDVVAINDLADAETMAHLFSYDSTHGRWQGSMIKEGEHLRINGKLVSYSRVPDPAQLPWRREKVDVVVECTGIFKSKELSAAHLAAGARRVLISAPPEGEGVPILIHGVNDLNFDFSEEVISCASCTTNSAAPMIRILDEVCGIESCYVTTVHSYTLDQRLHDAPHKDLRRARAAAASIVPTSTGAAKALNAVFPHLEDRIGGCGIRVPVPNGSLTDLTAVVRNPLSRELINEHFHRASADAYKGIVEYTEDPIVSRDVLGNSHSCVFDAELTSVVGQMVKVVGWYDNETGYANRLADTITRMSMSL